MKYDVRICRCGHIHFIKMDDITEALRAEKEIVVICACCGAASIIGADKFSDFDENGEVVDCYDMYSSALRAGINIDESFFIQSQDSHAGKFWSSVIYSKGVAVPMMTGMDANHYDCAGFSDMIYPNLYEIDRTDITPADVHKFIEEYHRDRCTVNMKRLLQMLDDDQAEGLSHLIIPQLNWSGTKWATKYNSK